MSKRYFIQDFKSEYNEHPIIVRFHNSTPEFTTEAIKEKGKQYDATKVFPSLDAICVAIDKYELSLRKDFVNPTAYRIVRGFRGWGCQTETTYETVTVTSVIDENYCWITDSKGSRAKEPIAKLFDDLDELKKHHKEWLRIESEALNARTKAEAVVNQFRWKPKKANDV
jgi:hypothetical protein